MPVSDLPRRTLRWVVPLLAGVCAATAGAVAAATPAHASVADCELNYSLVWLSDDHTGFQAEVTVRNIGSTPTTKWVALIGYRWGTEPRSVWSATENVTLSTTSGQWFSFTSVPYNSVVKPGEQATFGFLGRILGDSDYTPSMTTCGVF